MDSGIYRLTYKTGQTYVGKSIHLKTRWKQHFDKLSKGKAAKNMQEAYYASDYCYPQTEVLLYCHPDMLDYYEGYFINYLQPELNTSIPDLLPEESQRLLVFHANHDMAKYSIIDLIQTVHKTVDDLEEKNTSQAVLSAKVAEVISNFEKLQAAWNNRAMQDNWAHYDYQQAIQRFAEVETQRDQFKIKLEELEAWQLRVNGANWWQRLWQSW